MFNTAMSDRAARVIPVLIDGAIVMRVYVAGQLTLELPLRRRQALVIAQDLIGHALTAERDEVNVLAVESP